MIATLIFVLILSLLIIVHEFGHFIAARKNGVRVENFSWWVSELLRIGTVSWLSLLKGMWKYRAPDNLMPYSLLLVSLVNEERIALIGL